VNSESWRGWMADTEPIAANSVTARRRLAPAGKGPRKLVNNSTLEQTVSQKDDAPETLYPMAEIEKAWMESLGEFRRFSPLEWAYLEAWLQAGISPASIIEGIQACCQNFRPKYRTDGIRSLVYCQQAIFQIAQERSVEEFWERRRKAQHQQEAQAALAERSA